MTNLNSKFRPKNFSEIVGHKFIIETLKRSIINKNIAPAYLFFGGKGTGKTSMARVFATSMNCKNFDGNNSCGECESCTRILSGTSNDVIEIDAASNRGIDNIKQIIESALWPPQESSYKVYIIDECHQLTSEANNALLKILEEPPPYLKFILCTTERAKMKAFSTVMSRCQKFTFTNFSNAEIFKHLKKIAQQENIVIEDSALKELTLMAGGAMRDAVGYLEQIAQLGLDNITYDKLCKYYHISERQYIYEIVGKILDGNAGELLFIINDLINSGVEVEDIIKKITDTFRNILLYKACNDINLSKKMLNLPQNDVELIVALSDKVKSIKLLAELPKEFSDFFEKKQVNLNDRWLLESALIRCIGVLN
jgi:DNA polymerase-3 subunit gamma/tau